MAEIDDRQIQKTDSTQIAAVDNSTYNAFLDTAAFNQTWRAATLLAKSDLVPLHYKNKPENCFLAFTAARRVNADPFVFMQKTFVVGGKLCMESQYMIAMVNTRGPFTGPIQWQLEKQGDKIVSCTAYATHKITGEKCEATVTWKMVEAEGWSKKTGSKWLTLPELMFKYRSAAFLARLYCPEVLFGMRPVDEAEDIQDNVIPEKQYPVSNLEDRLSKKINSVVKSTNSEQNVQQEDDNTNDYPSNSTQDAPHSQNTEMCGIDPSERYYCRKCDRTMPTLGGLNKNLCGYCLSMDVVDRLSEK